MAAKPAGVRRMDLQTTSHLPQNALSNTGEDNEQKSRVGSQSSGRFLC
jgi:hypothetical protein